MNRLHYVLGLGAALVAATACGDNSKQCGPGTTDVDGVCTATPVPPVMCTDGTIAGPDGNCVIDPNSCQDGTVLVGGACVDPGHVKEDITEAAEPNGLGLLGETSTDPAGAIVIKPAGQHFVIHGTIKPFQDLDGDGALDPDVDSYVLEVNGPALISMSADGLHGLAAGFAVVAAVPDTNPLATWQRLGVNLTGDTSKRSVFLPAAGTYVVGIADTRSLFLSAGAVGPAPGGLDFEYYVTVDQLAVQPTALTLDANGVATSSGTLDPGETKLFSVPMGAGINTGILNIPGTQSVESIVMTNTHGGATVVKGIANGDNPNPNDPATSSIIGIQTGDTQIVAADTVFNYALDKVPYDLTIKTGGAGALSTTGQTVAQPGSSTDFTVFFYDVATDGEVTGMDLSFDVPVAGFVLDENGFIFANFTNDPDFGFAFGDTFQSYKGLLHERTAGRYYFLVFDPTAAATTINATSSYAPTTVVPITAGTAVTAQAVNAFASNPFTFDAGTSAWEQFRGAADGGTTTGSLAVQFIDQANSFGRVDPLVSTCTSGGTDFCRDMTPIFTHTYAEAGTILGRILLNDPTTKYFLDVRPAAPVAGSQFLLDFTRREFTDLGTVAPGTPATRTDQQLDGTVTVQRYLLKTTAGNGVSIVATPKGTLNTKIQRLNVDESSRGAAGNNGGAGAVDQQVTLQGAEGFTAFTITSVATLTTSELFDLAVATSAPVPFDDACVGGSVVDMQDADEGYSTANISTPAGFDYFGLPATAFKVNSNGFLTFDLLSTCSSVGSSCFFSNANMPAAANPNGVVAAYWDDLISDEICQKTNGTKLTIQWTGTTFSGGNAVRFQAILDGSNDSITFVYAATHTQTGTSATIGVENLTGTAATLLGFNTANTIVAGASIQVAP